MSNETTMTVVGNLTGDPELGFTATGVAVVRFQMASTPRRYDQQARQWGDGEALFLRCVAWRGLGEHAAECLGKGDRVIVSGRLRANNWETAEGAKRSGYELVADEVGPSLRYATVHITRTRRSEAGDANEHQPGDESEAEQAGMDVAPF